MLRGTTDNYRNAMNGEGSFGSLGYDWADKPHRLVYDLCNHIDELQELYTKAKNENERHRRAITNTDLILWCIHILGPDDIIAAPTYGEAIERAYELNLSIHERDHEPKDLLCYAYVAPWPYSKEEHAKDIEEYWSISPPPAKIQLRSIDDVTT